MKIDIKKSEKKGFEKVELREPTVRDFIAAERVSGGYEGFKFSLALLAEIGTFDGKKLVMEDLENIALPDFLELSSAMEALGIADLAGASSSSSEMGDSHTTA